MTTFLLFTAEVLSGIIFTTAGAYFVKKISSDSRGIYLFNALCSLIATICVFIICRINLNTSLFILKFGIIFGIATMAMSLLRTFAAKEGPLGHTSLIVTLSSVITAASGCIFWHERLTLFKVIGIILMVICFIFSIDLSNKENKQKTLKWFMFSILAMLATVGVGLIQKIQQESTYKSNFGTFLFAAFVAETIISFALYFIEKQRNKTIEVKFYINLKYIICMLISGICIGTANITAVILTGRVDTALVFPIVNGVPLMGNIVLGMILFNERIQKRQLIGIASGILAIACLCI